MPRECYLVVLGVPEPSFKEVKAAAQKRPVAKINASAYVVGLKSTSDYSVLVGRLRASVASQVALTLCIMDTDSDTPTVFPDGGADTPEAETIIRGEW